MTTPLKKTNILRTAIYSAVAVIFVVALLVTLDRILNADYSFIDTLHRQIQDIARDYKEGRSSHGIASADDWDTSFVPFVDQEALEKCAGTLPSHLKRRLQETRDRISVFLASVVLDYGMIRALTKTVGQYHSDSLQLRNLQNVTSDESRDLLEGLQKRLEEAGGDEVRAFLTAKNAFGPTTGPFRGDVDADWKNACEGTRLFFSKYRQPIPDSDEPLLCDCCQVDPPGLSNTKKPLRHNDNYLRDILFCRKCHGKCWYTLPFPSAWSEKPSFKGCSGHEINWAMSTEYRAYFAAHGISTAVHWTTKNPPANIKALGVPYAPEIGTNPLGDAADNNPLYEGLRARQQQRRAETEREADPVQRPAPEPEQRDDESASDISEPYYRRVNSRGAIPTPPPPPRRAPPPPPPRTSNWSTGYAKAQPKKRAYSSR